MRVERQRTPFLPVRVHELCNESVFFFYLPYEWKYCNKFQIFLKFYFSNVYFCKRHLPGPLRRSIISVDRWQSQPFLLYSLITKKCFEEIRCLFLARLLFSLCGNQKNFISLRLLLHLLLSFILPPGRAFLLLSYCLACATSKVSKLNLQGTCPSIGGWISQDLKKSERMMRCLLQKTSRGTEMELSDSEISSGHG